MTTNSPLNAQNSRFHIAALFIFLSLITVMMIGNLSVRLANSNADDNPVFYAMYRANPARFEGDIVATYAPVLSSSSLQNWLPLLLLKTTHLPPIIPSWIFVFIQGVLLGLAMFRFANLVTGRIDVAWLTVLFCYAAQAWGWNLANYGTPMMFPYAGALVLPFIVLAATEVLRGSLFRTAIFLVLAGLIHPAVTLLMLVIVGIYWLPIRAPQERQPFLMRLLVLGIVAAVCIGPAWYLQSLVPDPLSASELMPALRRNLHMSPWTEPNSSHVFVPTFVGFFLVSVLAVISCRAAISSSLRLWFASLLGATILAAVYFIGWFSGIPKVVQLVPLRATLFFVLFSLPIVVLYLSNKLTSPRFMTRWATALLLLSLGVFGSGFFWGPLALLFSDELSNSKFNHLANKPEPVSTKWIWRLGQLALLAWIGLIFFAASSTLLHVATRVVLSLLPWLIPGVRITFRSYFFLLFIVVASAAVGMLGHEYVRARALDYSKRTLSFFRSSVSRRQSATSFGASSPQLTVLALLLLSIVVFNAWETGSATSQPAIISNFMTRFSSFFGHSWQGENRWYNCAYQAQVWARDNTPEDAVFITYRLPWRTMSLRRSVNPEATQSQIYTGSRRAKKFDDDYLAFYGLENSFQRMGFSELILTENVLYEKLDEADILRLANQFGGDYIVRVVSQPLNFPEVYRNEQFVIYKLAPH